MSYPIKTDVQVWKDKSRQTTYDLRVGCLSVGYIFSPNKNKKRDKYLVRLLFEQERGRVDFTKDKEFKTMEEAQKYFHIQLRRFLRGVLKQTYKY